MSNKANQFEKTQFNAGNHLAQEAESRNISSHPVRAVSEVDGLNGTLPENERELFHELARAVRTIAYGSIVLTIHEGRLVEISKTIRLRKSQPSRKA
jgi:hypothetical protein